ncbi:MAG: guanylate kinase [Nitrospira sp.]|nr:guanylate kinase [Nitrospira sp.]
MSADGVLVVVSGPSGVGKTTLCKNIVARLPDTMFSVSYTTRKPRPGEREGVEYCFVDETKFQDLIREEAFVEWAEVYGHKYGTPKQALLEALHKGINVLLEIDAQGARQIMERFAGAVYVFVAPPSLDALRNRLCRRNLDARDEIERRLHEANDEIANFKSYHYFVRNDELLQATQELESIILAEQVKTNRLDPEWLVENGLVEPVMMKKNVT